MCYTKNYAESVILESKTSGIKIHDAETGEVTGTILARHIPKCPAIGRVAEVFPTKRQRLYESLLEQVRASQGSAA